MSALTYITSFDEKDRALLEFVPKHVVKAEEYALIDCKVLNPSDAYEDFIECPYGCGELEKVIRNNNGPSVTYGVCCTHSDDLHPPMSIAAEKVERYSFDYGAWRALLSSCKVSDAKNQLSLLRDVLKDKSRSLRIAKSREAAKCNKPKEPYFALTIDGAERYYVVGEYVQNLIDLSSQGREKLAGGVVSFLGTSPYVHLKISTSSTMTKALEIVIALLTTRHPKGVTDLSHFDNPRSLLARKHVDGYDFTNFMVRCDENGCELSGSAPSKLYKLVSRPR